MQQFWQLLCQMDMFDESSHSVYFEYCLQTLTGVLSEDQQGLIRQVCVDKISSSHAMRATNT